jgi:protein gp37
MATISKIEWTDATWNPVSGCLMVSPGCTNCYAMRMAARLQAMEHPSYAGVIRKSGGRPVWTGRLHLNEAALEVPLRWRTPRRIFVNSMSDLFQDGVPNDFITKVWRVMERAHWHSYQILTKRPENMRDVVANARLRSLPNVWLGTSVESSDYLDRIDILRSVSAAIRFVSFEPLIGAVGRPKLNGIHWAIVGGESGPGARLMKTKWVTDIQSACDKYGTAFFFKQWGGVNKKKTGRILNGRTWDEYPDRVLIAAE